MKKINQIYVSNTPLIMSDTIELQMLDWKYYDETQFSEYKRDGEIKKKMVGSKFIIQGFGVNEEGNSVAINVRDFPPHFYIGLDSHISREKLDMFVKTIKNKLPFYCKNDIDDSYDIVKRKHFYGFDNGTEYPFIRILFKSLKCFTCCSKILEKELKVPGFPKKIYKLYETNIPPLLRFIHFKNIKPATWISFKKSDIVKSFGKRKYSTKAEYDINWKNIIPIEKSTFAPFKIASFDIECDSSHGDFPLPKKTYTKLCREILYNINKKKTNINTHIYDYIKEAFSDNITVNDRTISKIYSKNNIKPSEMKLKIASSKLFDIYNRKETYDILAKDILLMFKNDEKHVQELIEDAFCDISNPEEKTNFDITTIYTKQNKKPPLSYIKKASIQVIKLYNKYINSSDNEERLDDIISEFATFLNLTKVERTEKYNKHDLNIIYLLIDQISITLNKYFPELDTSKEVMVKRFDNYMSQILPDVDGDKVIQIGTTVQKYGDTDCYLKHILTLNGCEEIDGCIVESFDNEEEMLLRWSEFIRELDPDIITGYNIFGFDYTYLIERADELECLDDFCKMSREIDKVCPLVCKSLSSSALGDNTLKYIDMDGRVQMDLLKIIQRDHNLPSYKLDYVAENFINNKIVSYSGNKIIIKGIISLNKGNFITFNVDKDKYKDGKKLKITNINYDTNEIEVDDNIDESITAWTLAKDDVSVNDIFNFQKGSDYDRKVIATYCIQDCALCLHIINKLKLITNNIAMANVCSVPLSFIFLRGQGIKIFSLVSKECRKDRFIMPVVKCKRDDKVKYNSKFTYSQEEGMSRTNEGFEGAGVLNPMKGIYLDVYSVVLDFASLYPSCIISENISHDSICLDKKYLGEEGKKVIESLGLTYKDISYSTYKWIDPSIRSKGKVKTGEKTCRYIQFPDGKKSILGMIEANLLAERKKMKKKMNTESDPILKEIYDGEQLAIKLTCNSLYGQLGAETSPIFMLDLAASVTATGRKLLYMARDKIQNKFEGAEALYGDTDSVFINFKPKDEKGNLLKGKEGLKRAIELGVEAEKYVQNFLEKPHKLEYEKTFWPFILFSKKRYIGHKYEFDIDNYKETSMGIVLKRRDNANIVKHVYGGVVKNIMINKDIPKSITDLRKDIMDMINGVFKLDMLVITKTLKGTYKNPDQIAHKVLAERIGKRDPGNKPMVNDRIPFVYIEKKEKKGLVILQGDRIEHPDYIKEKKLTPDYKFYITNQILKPVCQIYSLIIEQMEGFKKEPNYYENKYKFLLRSKTEEKANQKIIDMKMEDTSEIIFGDILRDIENKRKKVTKMTHFFKKK